jgi:hypothetical protein
MVIKSGAQPQQVQFLNYFGSKRRQFGSSLTAVTTNTLNPFLKVQTSCCCQICVISLNCNLCRDLFKGFYPAPLIIPGLVTSQGDQKLFPRCSAIMMIFMCPYPDSKHWKVFHSIPSPNCGRIFQTKTSSSYAT